MINDYTPVLVCCLCATFYTVVLFVVFGLLKVGADAGELQHEAFLRSLKDQKK